MEVYVLVKLYQSLVEHSAYFFKLKSLHSLALISILLLKCTRM
jgi:hypothetical protein